MVESLNLAYHFHPGGELRKWPSYPACFARCILWHGRYRQPSFHSDTTILSESKFLTFQNVLKPMGPERCFANFCCDLVFWEDGYSVRPKTTSTGLGSKRLGCFVWRSPFMLSSSDGPVCSELLTHFALDGGRSQFFSEGGSCSRETPRHPLLNLSHVTISECWNPIAQGSRILQLTAAVVAISCSSIKERKSCGWRPQPSGKGLYNHPMQLRKKKTWLVCVIFEAKSQALVWYYHPR